MSAFMVSDDCIQNILSLAAGWTVQRLDCWKLFADGVDNVEALGVRLIALNAQAVESRYGDRAEELTGGEVATAVNWRMKHVPLLPAIKALDCWLYQCAEGDLPKTLLYEQMRKLRDTACRSYVQAQPEYDAAEWG